MGIVRSALSMHQAFQVAPGPIYSAEKPVRSRAYMQFIKRFPCLVCGKKWGIDPCHTGPHAYGEKASDYTCIPLCRKHHEEFDSAPETFARKHHLNIPALICGFLRRWAERMQRTTR